MRYEGEINKNTEEIESKLQNIKKYIPLKGAGGIGMGHGDREDINRDSNRVRVIMQITARPN